MYQNMLEKEISGNGHTNDVEKSTSVAFIFSDIVVLTSGEGKPSSMHPTLTLVTFKQLNIYLLIPNALMSDVGSKIFAYP